MRVRPSFAVYTKGARARALGSSWHFNGRTDKTRVTRIICLVRREPYTDFLFLYSRCFILNNLPRRVDWIQMQLPKINPFSFTLNRRLKHDCNRCTKKNCAVKLFQCELLDS